MFLFIFPLYLCKQITCLTKSATQTVLGHSSSHLLRQLSKPVGDEQGGVDEPVHAVGQAGLLSTRQGAAGVAHAQVPAGLVQLVHLVHELQFLLLHSYLCLKVSPSSCSQASCTTGEAVSLTA